MGVILFKCSVCKGKFTSKGSWLRHLLELPHSKLTRLELVSNWNEKKTREEVIVVYSKQEVGKDDKILQYFSKDIYKGIVTDFVWWKERPRIGFIQFESRKVAQAMISSLHSKDNRIILDNQQFQFRHGLEYLDLEWDELLPLTERLELEGGNHKDITLEGDATPSKAFPPQEHHKCQTNELFNINQQKVNYFLKPILYFIQEKVRIPNEDLDPVVRIDPALNHFWSKKLSKKEDEISAHLIRNWCLNLKYHRNIGEVPTVFLMKVKKKERILADRKDNSLVNDLFKILPSTVHNSKSFQLCGSKTAAKSLTGVSSMLCDTPGKNNRKGKDAGTKFKLICNVYVAVESQLWRLTKFLVSFDVRCKYLMQIVYYWANLNEISFGKEAIAKCGRVKNSAPDPLGLTWMVLFFLVSEGVIPTPDQILMLEHKPIYFGNPNFPSSALVDLGFNPDLEFQRRWLATDKSEGMGKKQKCSPSHIFLLAAKFFRFWEGFCNGSWLVSTRDGKYYKTEEFLKLGDAKGIESNKIHGSLQEILRTKYCKKKKTNGSNGSEVGKSQAGLIYMTNPFHETWRISVRNEALESFKPTSKKLKLFMDQLEKGEMIDEGNSDLENYVASLFTI